MINKKLLKRVLPLAIGLSSLFPTQSNAELPWIIKPRPTILSRLENLIETRNNNNFSLFSPIYSFPNLMNNSNLEGDIKKAVDQNNVGEIYETPVLDQDELMKVAVVYPKSGLESKTGDILNPIIYMPGYSAGASVYLDYANNLAENGYLVLIPEINGDTIHFFSIDSVNDNFIEFERGTLLDRLQNIKNEVQKVEGYESYDTLLEVGNLVMIHAIGGEVQNQKVLDIIDKNLFKYRDDALDSTVQLAYEINQDKNSPLYGRIDTENIGLEGHSLGPHSIFTILSEKNPPFWVKDIKAFISKGGISGFQSLDRVSKIGNNSSGKYPYVYFMLGEHDVENTVLQSSWDRFQVLDVPAVYTLLNGAGHMVFTPFPLSFITDKYTSFGDRSITMQEDLSAQKTYIEISKTFFDAVLKNDKKAMKRIKRENFDGIKESYTINFE